MVLGGDVEVLRKGTACDETCTFLNTDYVPRSVEVMCQGTRIRVTCRSTVPGEDLERVSLSPAALIRTKSSTRRATGLLFQDSVAVSRSAEREKRGSESACRARTAGCARRRPSRCHLPGNSRKRRPHEDAAGRRLGGSQ